MGTVRKSAMVKLPTKRVSNVGGVEPWGAWAAASWVAESAAKTAETKDRRRIVLKCVWRYVLD